MSWFLIRKGIKMPARAFYHRLPGPRRVSGVATGDVFCQRLACSSFHRITMSGKGRRRQERTTMLLAASVCLLAGKMNADSQIWRPIFPWRKDNTPPRESLAHKIPCAMNACPQRALGSPPRQVQSPEVPVAPGRQDSMLFFRFPFFRAILGFASQPRKAVRVAETASSKCATK